MKGVESFTVSFLSKNKMIDELVSLVTFLFNYISSNNVNILKDLTNKHGRGILKEIRLYFIGFLLFT
jgi:hypothetical protein